MIDTFNVRDFIYLDVERLKSILAQIKKGLPEQESKTTTEGNRDSLTSEAGIPKFFNFKGEDNYIWETQRTESKTLHDHIYNFVEDKLKDRIFHIPDSLKNIDLENDGHLNILTDTSFVLISGKAYINDYAYLNQLMESFNKLVKLFAEKQLDQLNIPQKSKKNYRKQYIEQSLIDKSTQELITTMTEVFFKDRTLIKILPFPENLDIRFVGTLNHQYLRESIYNIMYKYGTSPNSNWYMFAQIASIPKRNTETFELPPSTNEIDNAFHKLFDALRNIEQTGLTVAYPEIAVTPIAIYRE